MTDWQSKKTEQIKYLGLRRGCKGLCAWRYTNCKGGKKTIGFKVPHDSIIDYPFKKFTETTCQGYGTVILRMVTRFKKWKDDNYMPIKRNETFCPKQPRERTWLSGSDVLILYNIMNAVESFTCIFTGYK